MDAGSSYFDFARCPYLLACRAIAFGRMFVVPFQGGAISPFIFALLAVVNCFFWDEPPS